VQERWKALDVENTQILEAKKQGEHFIPFEFDNGDTAKQLLIRSRYLLTKDTSKWTESQKQRADILFQQYPILKQAYGLSQQLRRIYDKTTVKEIAYTKLAHWYNDVQNTGLKQFSTVINTMQINYKTILNYFDNRSTNASAESF
ncbi:transposase, partial [Myroides pelagicus]|uniref:transposase n=1 Tax=Myroides pelagicus TaxID=270914 RepID=UPI002DC034E5